MARSVNCRRISHTNLVIEDFAASVAFLEGVYGGSFMADLPGPDWHACLIEIGGLVVELFEPRNFLLQSRIGPHYLGLEFEADVDEARAAVADHGMRIIRDLGVAIHTDPFQGFGVDYEFYGGTFYGPDAPHLKTFTKSPEHWAAHPIGYTGLIGYTQAVADLAAATAFMKSFLGAEPIYETVREAIGARATGMRFAGIVCELVCPSGDGPLLRDMLQTGHGIRSTVYSVSDVAATRAYFEGRGLRVIAGARPGSVAVDPRDNLGILFEFVEQQ